MLISFTITMILLANKMDYPFNRQIIQLELFRFDKMEVHSFQIVLIDVTIMALTCLKGGTESGNNLLKTPIYSAPAVKGLKGL